MAKSETVVLCMPAQMGILEGAVTDVVLKPGMKVAALLGSKPTAGVAFDGNPNAFINAFNAQFVDHAGVRVPGAPHVRVRSVDVQREVDHEGQKVLANVPEHTAFLVDG